MGFLFDGWTGGPDLALLLIRVTIGIFFLLARFRWVYDPSITLFIRAHHVGNGSLTCDTRPRKWMADERHASLTNKLETCGYGHHPALANLVAVVELAAALGLIVGLLSPLAALGLIGVLIFATLCNAKEKVARQNPLDCVDWVCCYFWLVEPLYLVMALTILFSGAGRYSLDHLILSLWGG